MTIAAHREPVPSTALAAAFLRALVAWAERRSGGGKRVISAGAVDADELARVILALLRARSEFKASRQFPAQGRSESNERRQG